MSLTFGGDRQIEEFPCKRCDSTVERTWAHLDEDGAMRALFYASCYHHAAGGEVYFDVVIGTWGTGDHGEHSDHVTFGCRWGAIEGHEQPMCSLTTGGGVFADNPVFGAKPARPAAPAHPLLPEFWAMLDYLLPERPRRGPVRELSPAAAASV